MAVRHNESVWSSDAIRSAGRDNQGAFGANSAKAHRRAGRQPTANTPQEFGVFIRAEIEKYARIVEATGIRFDQQAMTCLTAQPRDHIILGETALAGARARSGYRHAGSQTNR
jgi:hypothetical protein